VVEKLFEASIHLNTILPFMDLGALRMALWKVCLAELEYGGGLFSIALELL
jgi:hypothetical protein